MKEMLNVWLVPILTGLILTIITMFFRDILSLTIIFLGIGGIFFILILLIRFMEDREKRWEKNKIEHATYDERLAKLENSWSLNDRFLRFEDRLRYIEGVGNEKRKKRAS